MKHRRPYFLILFLTTSILLMLQYRIKSSNYSNNSNVDLPKITAAVQQVFSETYAKGSWGNDGNGSGGGSTLEYTKRTRALIELLVYKYDIGVLVDVPCGHMAWMPEALDRIFSFKPSFKYLGLDIVPNVIRSNMKRFEGAKNMQFRIFDFITGPIPAIPRAKKGSTAIFSRDALQHVSLELVIKALESFSRSNVDYLFIGSYHGVGELKNITTGDYFAFDMSKIRGLPPPLEVISEETPDQKHILVFKKQQIDDFDFHSNIMSSFTA